MASLRACRRLLGVVLLALGIGSLLASSAAAQDRGVPRFGSLVNPDTVTAGPYDLGRLWSFAQPPLDYFAEQYDVQANERGLRHARLGTVRLPRCSGALVSPEGLLLTAARCLQSHFSSVADSLQERSFYARGQSQELSVPGLYAERLVEVEVVTGAVDSVRLEEDPRNEEAARTLVERQLQAEVGPARRVDVVREAGGTRQVAYTYHRYDDVRMAFVPDRAVRVTGRLGAPLSYPQHAWDVAFLRIYEDGRPLQTPHHFEVRPQGTRPGDAVFAVGHPPSTKRAETHEQLAFRREVSLPVRRAVLRAGSARLREYVDTTQTEVSVWSNRLAEADAARRRVTAQLESLQNEYLMARLRARDQQFRRDSITSSTSKNGGGGIMDRLAAIQEEKRSLASDYRTYSFLMHPAYASATLRRALLAYRVQQGDTAAIDSGAAARAAVPSQPPGLDAAALADHLEHLRSHAQDAPAPLEAALDSMSAKAIVQGSVFSEASRTEDRVQQREIPDADPALALVSALYDPYMRFRRAWEALRAEERRLTDVLSRQRHLAESMPVTLPADRGLRIADGRIQGYPYNGTVAPPFTTFYGLYERHHAVRAGGNLGDLPRPWRAPASAFDRATPLTTVASTDLGGGAYGGPLLNTSLQLIGIVFDGNVQSAAGDYLFLPDRMRVVAVDVRGVLEGLTTVYGANRLVKEMTEESVSQ